MANRRTGRSSEGRVRQAPEPDMRRPKSTNRQNDRRKTSQDKNTFKKKSVKTQGRKNQNERIQQGKSRNVKNQDLRNQNLKNTKGKTTRKRRRKRWSLGKKIAVILGAILVILITTGIAFALSKMNKIETVELDTDALSISDEIEHNETGYLNVALFGLDTRASDMSMGTRSDTIIVASLNRETGEVRLASIYRDTLLQQKDGTYHKANAAYAFGGPTDAIAMLNKNFDLDIQHYVSVDFEALVEVVDAVGGVEIDVTEEEIPYLNNYAVEVIENTGIDSAPVTEPGLQTLNGVQATGYARIRYTLGDDFKRTERQRAVIEQIVKKVQSSNLRTLNKIIDKIFPKVETNFTLTEILAYAKNFTKYKMGETKGFPEDNTTARLAGVGDSVIPQTLESNARELHKFLFGEDGYSPSSTVTKISSEITSKSKTLADEYNSGYYDDDYDDYYYDYDYDTDDDYDYDDSDYDDSDYNYDYDDSDYDDSYDSYGNTDVQ